MLLSHFSRLRHIWARRQAGYALPASLRVLKVYFCCYAPLQVGV